MKCILVLLFLLWLNTSLVKTLGMVVAGCVFILAWLQRCNASSTSSYHGTRYSRQELPDGTTIPYYSTSTSSLAEVPVRLRFRFVCLQGRGYLPPALPGGIYPLCRIFLLCATTRSTTSYSTGLALVYSVQYFLGTKAPLAILAIIELLK